MGKKVIHPHHICGGKDKANCTMKTKERKRNGGRNVGAFVCVTNPNNPSSSPLTPQPNYADR